MPDKISPVNFDKAWEYIKAKADASLAVRETLVASTKLLQWAAGDEVVVDGKFGPNTALAIAKRLALTDGACCHPLPIYNGVTPEVSSDHADSTDNDDVRKKHRGVDIMYKIDGQWVVPQEVPLLNIALGVVIRRELRSNGWCVAVEHINGQITQNRHLASPSVDLGERVLPGKILAYFDQSQKPPHCHFEWYARGGYDYSASMNPEHDLLASLPMASLASSTDVLTMPFDSGSLNGIL